MAPDSSNTTRTMRPRRSGSFNWGTKTASAVEPRQMRRPKTQPELFAWRSDSSPLSLDRGSSSATAKELKGPSKILVNVTVYRSLGAVQLMASTVWTVSDLIAAAVQVYVKEERRPILPTTALSDFTLHYSQFSLEGLGPEEKLMELGSRNFFLYSKSTALSLSASASCSNEVQKSSKNKAEPWFNFAGFLL
ncbi:hypothetical protein J5N97_021421 [Dioscorea zingiberensis]|uniref:DUF7054 domain-containing protein n=1 Tax=Dioscorea zingiberensis TaxID=325984 RepID=A0A9D5CHM4_9LILI|nr:hypothetical protein J5N97_021421 [Dioscorea zingiberensis]